MTDLVKIGDLAKRTGLSIRTLHYYDQIGLLSPSHRNSAGHRFYDSQDIIQLQQILSLRQLGFSLDEIRDCLQSPEFSLPQVIELHRARVREQIALSRTLLKRLNAIAQELETTHAVAVENLIEAMETISMSGQYFTTEQQAVLETRFSEHETEWQALLSQIRTEMDKGTDFNSPDVRILARRWLAGMKSFIQGDHSIYASLTRMVQQEEPTAVSWGRMDAATFEYMLKAVSMLTLGETTESLIPRDKIFSPATQHVLQLGEDAMLQIYFDFIGTEAILLGLLADDTNLATQVLNTAGITFTAVQPLVTKWLGVRPQPPAGWHPSPLPFTGRTKRVIELALDEAKGIGHHTHIEPEHLLLGILDEHKESGGLATYILQEELSLDLSQLEQQLRATMSQ
ncbi:family transcriptional regulator [Leptolyngbya sp. Heron Island J]|uniref:MerR family transcriptional regulator n=1 Tax=Leptolyngbya sp. Heron Island J TaxID=1385935 RepID=UPI0003B99532|nr:MerR family transcriptional regulator [Leptolyngbya sp. Heron Island J]ESA32898.1 family transcriptional regulator [Leptolyngbya sp. Heron Island J]